MILDNAFLVHRPGIKTKKTNYRPKWAPLKQQTYAIEKNYAKEIVSMFGNRPGCCATINYCTS